MKPKNHGIHNTLRHRKWLFAAPLLIVTIMSVSFSKQVYSEDRNGFEQTGDVLQVLIPATAYASTFYMDDRDGRIQFYKSFFTNLGITHALKYTVAKQRPENHGSHSFPSGHTSAAFQGASFIHRRYGWKFGIPAYLGAAFVGWSRIEGESDQHDIIDVIAGAGIGIASSFFFTEPYKGVRVKPIANNNFWGISFSKKW
jgi:membrane-associated phospholipid phosphatase